MSPAARYRYVRQLVMIVIAAVMVLSGSTVSAAAQPTHRHRAVTYYVNAASGNDNGSGTNPGHAWRSLAKVDATTFAPGDRILFHAGQAWTGQLWPKGSGVPGRPISVGRYGPGAKPKIIGGGEVPDAVRLYNQQYWHIASLDVSNERPPADGVTPESNLADLRGIGISGDEGGQLSHFVIDGVDVHDVSGVTKWISDNGWDASKDTGGIVFRGLVADPQHPGAATVFHDIVVENSTIENTSFAGITVKQYTGSDPGAVHTGWGERPHADDTSYTPHTHVVIKNNYITQKDTAFGCDGIYLTDTRGGLIEGNVVAHAGTSGIETYADDGVTVRKNEVYGTTKKAGGADFNGIDADIATTNMLIEQNFVHDNGDGILLCQCRYDFGSVQVRNNVIVNNSRYQVYLHSVRGSTALVDNNTIVTDDSNYLVYGYGSSLNATYKLRNNILYSSRPGAVLTTSPTIEYESNLYGGPDPSVPASDTRPVVGAVLFRGTVSGPYGTATSGPALTRALALELQSGSRGIDDGMVIADNGGHDYAGAALYNDQPDIGAFEYYTPREQGWESISGYLRDQYGAPVGDASIVLSSAGHILQASSQPDGHYRLTHVRFGAPGELTISKADHTTASARVRVTRGDILKHDVILVNTQTVGQVAGRVLDAHAQPIAGATVTISTSATVAATGTTGADGSYDLAGLAPGDDYTITATAIGHLAAQQGSVEVTPGHTTTAPSLLLAPSVADVIVNDTFDNVALGPLADGTDGWQVPSTASANSVSVVATPSESDRSINIDRAVNSGSTSMTKKFDSGLQGLITVEAQVMRDDPEPAKVNWFNFPYLYNLNGDSAVSVALTGGEITAYDGSTAEALVPYTLGTWYDIRLVIDTVNQRFDLYVDNTLMLHDAAFRHSTTAIGSLGFSATSSNYGSGYVNDVKVAYGRL